MHKITVDFSRVLRDWDGFGVNYVETAQTYDYAESPQDYGGFSTLSEDQRTEVIDAVFGDDGLRPGVVKMFCDPLQQAAPGAPGGPDDRIDPAAFDHETTTAWMRKFVREGLALTRARGEDLQVLATLYGPPGWMTRQKVHRGRDLDPAHKYDLARYLVAFAKHMREAEGIPVGFLSVHNEGEGFRRWNADGITEDWGHDYNLLWPPEQVAEMLPILQATLKREGLGDIGVTPGETSNWHFFGAWGYGDVVADDPAALAAIGLITSHGFFGTNPYWYGDYRSVGVDRIRDLRPELHCWTTSTSWKDMDALFAWELVNGIYSVKVNSIIPWACIQRHSQWRGGDPNPGCAFLVDDAGGYSIQDGYWTFKQFCRAGQAGMGVAETYTNDTNVVGAAFASNGSKHPDATVLANIGNETNRVTIRLRGTDHTTFRATRSGPGERWADASEFTVTDGEIAYDAPAKSITTFFGR